MDARKILTTIVIAAGISTGFRMGKTDLEHRIRRLQTELQNTQERNYRLQLELIKNGNPHGWELYGDALGNWGYRRPSNSMTLGSTRTVYTYLEQNRGSKNFKLSSFLQGYGNPSEDF